ncbi:carcinoembryonic antigen-related cell adhesion molecule 5-like isoform X2 [Channa argus]|uniref:carcinoembryonic antigen-related cell adhesion molecule 5-like isoform X2 n=1 Tax=Channa argus TaxID=215402 RepID=UPI003522F3AE
MDIIQLICVFSVAFTGLTSGTGMLPDGPLTAAVGGAVMFTTTRTPSNKPFVFIGWIFNHNNTDTNIITSTSTDNIGPDYVGRITLSKSTGSLELRNLTLSDSGGYRVTLTVDGGNQETGSTRLEILARDRVQLTDGGSTLTIVNVTRYDQGPFRCKVSNAVSNGTSEPVKLSISYGPDDVNLKKSLSPEECVVGSNVDLSCSAVSSPSAQFSWFLNGSMLPEAGPELRLMNIQMNQSGSYSCQAFNNKTLRYKTSQPAAIIVIVPVSNVTVTVSDIDLVEFNSSVRLCCSSSGSSLSFLWLNGSSEVTAIDRVQLTDGGSTVTIVNVTRYDQGPFRCKVSNAVSNGTSDLVNLSISFGPENIVLKPPSSTQDHFVVGSNIDLSCSAVSRPAALFYWFLNGNLLPDTGPELSMTNIHINQSGNYSCQAFNNKTLRYQTSQPAAINIRASPIQQSPTCSAGCIAGIVITCCVIVGACAVAGYFIFYKKKLRKASTNITSEHQDTAANSRNQELNYANVSTLQNRDGGIVQLGLQNNSTEYAQIRLNSFPAASSPPTYDVHMQRMKRQAPQPGANGAQANTHVYIDKLVRSDSHQM